MIGSLFTGVSGLNANATAMSVIGDNIANVNTTAFKSNSTSFANILSRSLCGSASNNVGRGVELWGTSASWNQGSLETTGNPTDLAINGNGFFMVKDTSGSIYYTRAGAFTFDKNGNLVNPDGLRIQGYEIDPATGGLRSISDIRTGSNHSPARATEEMSMNMNLDGGAVDGEAYSNTMTVYDSLGNALEMSIDFTYDGGNNRWDWTASSSDGTCTTTGTLAFDSYGELNAATVAAGNPVIEITNLSSGAADLEIEWSYISGGQSDGSITGFSGSSSVSSLSQDGYAAGDLQTVSVDEDGVITGIYSNGQVTALYQLALADFPSYWGLESAGHGLYSESSASGTATPGIPGSSSLGSISPSSLEMSNVDLASEFVKMITTQRAFQANSKVITTSDEILTDLINIKR